MKKFAVILSGCGVYDGSEIHEATLTMLAIKKSGADYHIFAPDMMQYHVINHLTGKEMPEKRHVLVESARIARGQIKPLQELNPAEFNALIMPGGFGAAKNLSDYAFKGSNMVVIDVLAEKLRDAHKLGKAIGAMCIAPVILANIFKESQVTIGNDKETAADIENMKAKHVITTSGGVVYDSHYNLFSTPCYMLDATIADIAIGCENIVKDMLEKMGTSTNVQ